MGSRYLLVSDLDGTLLGDDDALARFADWFSMHRGQLRLAYSTGRFVGSVLGVVETTPLPVPDAVLGAVGTQIHLLPGWRRVEEWPGALSGWDGERIRAILSEFPDLELQPDEFQAEHKISYYGRELDPAFLGRLRRRLEEAGLRVQLVYSSQRDLDVLPQGIDKGSAAKFLAGRWGVRPGRVMVAGDTGNDLAMFGHGFRGIVVANAHEPLQAIRSPEVYHAPRAHAAGVLDGVRHWLEQAD